ncbi:hypothetical protein A3C86_00690 [Candidatus Kaiserbacteria bacterium RIFCSPHIGHO2_02_FULL_49_16]|uniref:DUF2283 domain-containing protein n=1 Tax=Candidatus Kaiserbacteria bacterium RIFCSPHIGHO2_02_FULL_49_16 TaxID=1798490 RepID=A0A1F6DDF7_9BACT|nr:MAG: hypothetical protein A3C86_00690 [Candidatus Kaiserbacteria bacterium RIFCSPHIGHO2_02_FULL_49_16]
MKITYDKSVDALNLTIKRGIVARTIEVAPDVFLDVNAKGDPLYLEFIGASERIGRKNIGKITLGARSFRVPVTA